MSYSEQALYAPAILTVCYQLTFFFIAYGLNFDKVTDFAGGTNFALNAILSLVLCPGQIYTSKKILVTCLVLLWALRLAFFLLARVLKAGEDKRFDDIRSNFLKFLVFWIFQMIWIYTVGTSYLLLNASSDFSDFGSASDWVGLVLFLIGFLSEAISDQQKFHYRFVVVGNFKAQHPDQTPPICQTGLWKYSRQPNYFGEILLWIGMFILCLHNDSISWVSIVSPIFITLLLLFASGIPLSEQAQQKKFLKSERKEEYLKYRQETSLLIPLPNVLYRSLPLWFKRVFLFEFAFYESEFLKETE